MKTRKGLLELQDWPVGPVPTSSHGGQWSIAHLVLHTLLLTSHWPGPHTVIYHHKRLTEGKATDIQPKSPFPLRPGFLVAAYYSKPPREGLIYNLQVCPAKLREEESQLLKHSPHLQKFDLLEFGES